jgi:hypothetical protein
MEQEEAQADGLNLVPILLCVNAAPEWQARTLERKQEIGGGLSTRGACYPFFYALMHLWSAS